MVKLRSVNRDSEKPRGSHRPALLPPPPKLVSAGVTSWMLKRKILLRPFATANVDDSKDFVGNNTRVLWVMIAENQQNGWQDLEFRRLKLY